MKRKLLCIFLLLLFLLALPVTASAENLGFVTDQAGILTEEQRLNLEKEAARISMAYPCSVYIVTVKDFRDFDAYDVEECAEGIYSYYDLGYGAERDGLLLLLSMNDRDYDLYSYGSYANTVFSSRAKNQLDGAYLDNFRENDWVGGFADYLAAAEGLLADAENGIYVDPPIAPAPNGRRVPPLMGIGIVGVLPCLLALLVVSGFKSQMKTARLRTTAEEYVVPGSARLRIRDDRFINRTETRTVIRSDNGPRGSSGGGFSGGSHHSGKF